MATFEQVNQLFREAEVVLLDEELKIRQLLELETKPFEDLPAKLQRLRDALTVYKKQGRDLLKILDDHPRDRLVTKTRLLALIDRIDSLCTTCAGELKLPVDEDDEFEDAFDQGGSVTVRSVSSVGETDGIQGLELIGGDPRNFGGARSRNQTNTLRRIPSDTSEELQVSRFDSLLSRMCGQLDSIENLSAVHRDRMDEMTHNLCQQAKSTREREKAVDRRFMVLEDTVQRIQGLLKSRSSSDALENATSKVVESTVTTSAMIYTSSGSNGDTGDGTTAGRTNYDNLTSPRSESSTSSDGATTDDNVTMCGLMKLNVRVIENLSTMIATNTDSQRDHQSSRRLPRNELFVFDGDPINYQRFMDMFHDSVERKERDCGVKLNILYAHCAESVQAVLTGCHAKKDKVLAYDNALKFLKKRYGNPFIISQTWVNRLLKLPSPRSTKDLERFSIDLSNCYHTLCELDLVRQMNNDLNMHMIVSKLPVYLQIRWRKIYHDCIDEEREVGLEQLVNLVARATRESTYPMYSPDSLALLKPVSQLGQSSARAAAGTKPRATTMMAAAEEDEEAEALEALENGDEDTLSMLQILGESVNQVGSTQKTQMAAPTDKKKKPPRVRNKNGCPCCDDKHYLSKCEIFVKMSPIDRLKFVKQQGLCMSCFSKTHKLNECTSRGSCQVDECGARHNSSLHFAFVSKISGSVGSKSETIGLTTTEELTEEEEAERQENLKAILGLPMSHGVTLMTPSSSLSTFLPVTPVMVKGQDGWILAHALLDNGSSSTFCTLSLVRRLGLSSSGPSSMTINTLSAQTELSGERVTLYMTSVGGKNIRTASNVLAIENLPVSPEYIVRPEQLSAWSHLNQLRFPAVSTSQVDMLIGQNNAVLLKPRDRIDGQRDEDPYGVRTDLGWTIHGLTDVPEVQNPACLMTSEGLNASLNTDEEESLERKLDKLWELDHAEDVKQMSADDRRVLKLWDETSYEKDGHLYLPIPFKEKNPQLPDNFVLARRRLLSLSKRLEKDPVLKEMYVKGMTDYLGSGFAQEVTDLGGVEGLINYACHHPIEKEDKPGVVRIVFDFSALFLGVCLNAVVSVGPNFTNNLVDILIRFRQYGVVILGDVKGMFNQVRVVPEHCSVLRFLWWRDNVIGGEIVVFEMLTHTFGGIWCPSAASYAMRRSVHLYGHFFDQATCDAILRSFYVDDLLRSVLETNVGIRLLTQVRELLSRVGFELVKLGSNEAAVLQALPSGSLAKGFENLLLEVAEPPKGKVLGSGYGPKEDCMIVRIVKTDKPRTKRGMLSLLSSVFDPLGLLAPFIIVARILFQKLCSTNKIEWDEVIPDAIMGCWQVWIEDLEVILNFSIPRCISRGHSIGFRLHLHGFSDASQLAYAACVYAVVESSSGVTSTLLFAKSRPAPLKSTSIPRLELCASVLVTKLMSTVRRALDIEPISCTYWVDSMIVLCSIQSESRVFKTFVGNRIAAIQRVSEVHQWRYVPSQDNPADIPSRGCRAEELVKSDLWKSGPPFLLKTMEHWPRRPDQKMKFDEEEIKTERQMCFMVRQEQSFLVAPVPEEMRRYVREFPTWYRLLRATAWLRRFLLFFAKKRCTSGFVKFLAGRQCPTGFITPAELSAARLVIVRMAQVDISEKQRRSDAFQKLFPFNDDGVYRVGGRLRHAKGLIDYQLLHPLLLPDHGEILDLLIRSTHERLGHVGSERTLTEIRKEFWPLSSRKAIRRVLSKCARCKIMRSAPMEQLMSDLPLARVTPGFPPFHHCGVDFAGPFKVKQGRKQINRYICVITCFNTRAVHIELAPGLDTTSFLNAFFRFTSRRGNPARVFSDNGTNFVGGSRELKESISKWNLKQVQDEMLQREIEWQFNTPYASHHGGVWERIIRTIRGLYLGLVTEYVLNEDSLHTLTCLIEYTINSRPLTKLSEDAHDPKPLCPNDLLILGSGKVDAPPGQFNRYDGMDDRWRKNQYLAGQFWNRWIRQYLPTLQARVKCIDKARNLKKGDLVMLRDESTSIRLFWPLGVVREVFPGKDGLVRSVRVQTKKGLYERPIAKIVLLEGD